MFPRSLAFSTAFAVLASSLLHPAASAEPAEATEATESSGVNTWTPSLQTRRRVVPSAPATGTAWQARIASRLRAVPPARPRPPLPTDADSPLRASLDRIAAGLEDARVGIEIKDLQTGRTLYEHHGRDALNPASNHKLLTATAAVTLLGEDYRFTTTVLRDGDALVLRGGGDPSLQVEDLQALAADVDAQGVTRLVVDDSMFTERVFGPGYDPAGPGLSYMAPSGALSLQYNTVVVHVRRGSDPSDVSVELDPPCAHLRVERGDRSGPVRITTRAAGAHTVVRVDGRPRSGATVAIRRRIADPGLFTASTFADALGRPDLPLVRGTAGKDAVELATHDSAPLPEVLGSALKFSNNFTTEQVLRTLGHLAADAPGSWHNGAAVLRDFWRASGQDPSSLRFENASGLSDRGRVTPHAMVELVSLWAMDERAGAVMEALPVAGREGTLRTRLRRTHGRVRAKTGTLSDASGLTGVVTDRDGAPRYAFSVLVDSEHVGAAKRMQDRVVMALLRYG